MVGKHKSPRLPIQLPPSGAEQFNKLKKMLESLQPVRVDMDNTKIAESGFKLAIERLLEQYPELQKVAQEHSTPQVMTKKKEIVVSVAGQSGFRLASLCKSAVRSQEPRKCSYWGTTPGSGKFVAPGGVSAALEPLPDEVWEVPGGLLEVFIKSRVVVASTGDIDTVR